MYEYFALKQKLRVTNAYKKFIAHCGQFSKNYFLRLSVYTPRANVVLVFVLKKDQETCSFDYTDLYDAKYRWMS